MQQLGDRQQIFLPLLDLDVGKKLTAASLKVDTLSLNLRKNTSINSLKNSPTCQKLRLNKLQHEAIALIANLDHAKVPRVVGPTEHFPFFG